MNKNILKSLPIVAKMMGDKYDVEVIVGSSPQTNGKTIFIPLLPEDDREARLLSRGYIDHEASHCRYTDFSISNYPMLNAIEDIWIERELAKEFPGAKKNLSDLEKFLVDNNKVDRAKPDDLSVTLMAKFVNFKLRKEYLKQDNRDLAEEAEKRFKDRFGNKILKKTNEIIAPNEMDKVKSTFDADNMARKLLGIIKDFIEEQNKQTDPDQNQDQNGQQGDQSSDGQDQNGQDNQQDQDSLNSDAKSSSDSSDSEDGSESSSDSGSQEDEDSSGEDSNESGSGSDSDNSDDSDDEKSDSGSGSSSKEDESGSDNSSGSSKGKPGEDNDSGDSKKSDSDTQTTSSSSSGEKGGDMRPQNETGGEAGDFVGNGEIIQKELEAKESEENQKNDSELKTKDCFTGEMAVLLPHDRWEPSYRVSEKEKRNQMAVGITAYCPLDAIKKDLSDLKRMSANMRKKLLGVLESKNRSEEKLSRQGQKFSKKDLYRLRTKDTRIFVRRWEKKAINTAVYILLDNSGSMGMGQGNKLTEALSATYLLSYALNKIPRVSFGVGAYPAVDRVRGRLAVHELKGFSERLKLDNFDVVPDGGTPTTEAMWQAAYQLAGRKEERKMLFVFTDGHSSDPDATINFDAFLNKIGIEVFGVGMNMPDVKTYFKNSVVIQNMSQMAKVLHDKLKESL